MEQSKKKKDMRCPIVRDPSNNRVLRQPGFGSSAVGKVQFHSCVACGNNNSKLYVGPDGPESLCATCNKRLSNCKLRMWRGANGHVTARPTRGYQRVVAIGFKRRADGRYSQGHPKVRKATEAEHAILPAYRPKVLNLGRIPRKATAGERSEGGWEPNSSEADPEQEEGSSAEVEQEEDEDAEQEEDAEDDAEEEGDEEQEQEEEEEEEQEVREEVRQLNLRGRRVRIRRMVTSPVTPAPTHRKPPRIAHGKVVKQVGHTEDNDEIQEQQEPPRIERVAKRLRRSPLNPASAARSGSDIIAREAAAPSPTRPAAPSPPRSVAPFAPSASPLLKAVATAGGARGKALSFAVKASCSYGWLTRRRYVYVAFGLRFGSFKKVLGETFAMDRVPFAVCYIDDEGDEIIISEDADMRPMFEMAKGKDGALRVRLRPP